MEITLNNAPVNNAQQVKLLHPSVRILFSQFIQECFDADIPVWIYSGLRTFELQAELRRQYEAGESEIPAATAGKSYHNYGLAVDIYVWNPKLEKFNRAQSYDIYKTLEPIANKFGLRWLGGLRKVEMHHFDYNKVTTANLFRAFNNGVLDDDGYVRLDEVESKEVSQIRKKLVDNWNTNVGESAISETEEEEEIDPPKVLRKIAKIEKLNAVGIWQIIKLVADQYALSQNVVDATFSHSQGSLINYVQNVVQAPWLEFFGDTVGDEFYFFARKEPFDYNGWTNLPVIRTVYAEEVLSDDLKWYDGDIYSWYQIIPKGSFLGQQNLIFAYITAVFFEEYSEIWGSKPNIQVSNYVNFTKVRGKSNMEGKAAEDLRYMVESNAYLPFTRQGTITIRGTTSIKRGYKIFYHPTGEEFYVDAVSTRYQSSEGGDEYITILQVTRGMKIEYTRAPFGSDDISYFNLIDFSNSSEQTVEIEERIELNENIPFFFDNDRSYLVDLEEDFSQSNDTISQKMQRQIEAYPNLRAELDAQNKRSISKTVKIIRENPKAEKFVVTGFIDSDVGGNTSKLAKNRAVTVKGRIVEAYLNQYQNFTREQLLAKIEIVENNSGNVYFPLDEIVDFGGGFEETLDGQSPLGNENERTLRTKAFERFSLFEMTPYVEKKKKQIETKGINWKVRDKVFQFFINRKQNATQ